jgi:hypothetical protein
MHSMRTIGVLLVSGIVLTGFACSSGGSSGSSAGGAGACATSNVGFSATTAGTQEGGSDVNVTLALNLTGDPLDEEVHVGVSVAPSSTATQGSDYSLSGSGLTFPAGSANGTTRSLALSALDDASLEGMETVELELSLLAGDLALGSSSLRVNVTDGDSGKVEFDTASTTTADEASQSHTVEIELDIPSGATLEDALVVTVTDSGTGTATAGDDYTAFGTQNVTIPAGSSGGVAVDVNIGVLNDSTLEGDETVVLQLSVPSSVAQAGTRLSHTLTITDDDLSGSAALTILADGSALLHREQVDLDAAGPGGVELTIQNSGTGDITVTHPEVTSGNVGDFTVHLETGALDPAQLAAGSGEVASPLFGVTEDAGSGVTASFDGATLEEVQSRENLLLVGFPLPELGVVDLKLSRLDSPWTPDAVVRVDGESRSMDSVARWPG